MTIRRRGALAGSLGALMGVLRLGRPLRAALLLLVTCGLAGLLREAQAQADERREQPSPFAVEAPSPRFEHFGIVDGLVQGSVVDIMQDRQGFLWIATWGGLHRYDGHEFTVYKTTPFDTTSLSEGAIRGITEAHDGDLWVATYGGGLNRMDRATGAFTHYRHAPDDPASLSSDSTCGVLESRNGDLWVGTRRQGLNRMRAGEDGRFTHYRHVAEDSTTISSDRQTCNMSEDAVGHIWVGSINGINRIDPETDEVTRFLYASEPVEPPYQRRVLGHYHSPDEPGIVWITGDGLVRLDSKTGAHERFLVGPIEDGWNPLNFLNSVAPDPSVPGVLWMGGQNGSGLVRFDARTRQFVRYPHDPRDPNSLSGTRITSVFADRSGMIWVGTSDDGLNVFNPAAVNFSHLRHDPEDAQSLAPGSVYALYEDREGTLWVATHASSARAGRAGRYVTQFDAATGRVTRHEHDPNNPATLLPGPYSAFAEDDAGGFWVASWQGLTRLDRTTGRMTRFPHRATELNSGADAINYLLPSPSDRGLLWVGRDSRMDLFDTRTGSFTHMPLAVDSVDVTGVQTLAFDAGGTLWAAASQGLVRIDPDGSAALASAYDPHDTTTISSNNIVHIAERDEEPGILWLATQGGGLNRFDTRTSIATHYTEADGLPSDLVNTVLDDERGTLWLGTNRGISNFDPDTETISNYGLEDGLITIDFIWTFARGAGGVLYFGSDEGVTAFVPERLRTNTIAPQVALTGLSLFNEPVAVGPDSPLTRPLSETEQVTLAHNQNDVAFDFVALHFANAAGNQSAYWLEGFDRDWVDTGTGRTATYTNLPPGRYTFRVKAANSDGVWNEEGTSVGLVITPPWWRTWWAYVLYGVLVCAGVCAVDRVQRRRLLEVERRRAAGREARLRADLAEERTQYLEALDQTKSRFFANVSHELRTPLTLLLGPVHDALAGRFGPIDAGSPLARNLPLMQRSGERLLGLIEELLDLASLEADRLVLHAEETDLVALVRRTVVAFASRAEGDGLALSFGTGLDRLHAWVDAERVEQILSNLLANAFRFTPSGGRIRVELALEEGGDHGEGAAVLTVRDTGQGIDPDVLPHLFERFRQGDAPPLRGHSGTGIGLALVRELAELHGGSVAAESTPGFGSLFTVRLPLGTDHLPPEALVPPTRPRRAVQTQRANTEYDAPGGEAVAGDVAEGSAVRSHDAPLVLVVEDHADLRAYLAQHLAPHYRLEEAAEGQAGLEATRRLADAGDPPALVISDVMMPRLDGFGLCRALKADSALGHIPIVLLTARADEASRLEGLGEGADDYLAKPFSADELLARCENLIEVRRRLRARFSGQVVVSPTEVVVESEEAAWLEEVKAVVEAHLAEPAFTVEWLADALAMSTRSLQRRLKEASGLTPNAFLRTMRLERAAHLLRHGAGTVAEVARAVGYDDPSYFGRVFRQGFGVAPTGYAETMGEREERA